MFDIVLGNALDVRDCCCRCTCMVYLCPRGHLMSPLVNLRVHLMFAHLKFEVDVRLPFTRLL